MSTVGKNVTRARHIEKVWHFLSCQPTPELDDEELLIEVLLLRLGTNGAAAIEVGGDIVKSAARAPGKLPK